MKFYRIYQNEALPNQIEPLIPALNPNENKPLFIRGMVAKPEEYAYFSPMIEGETLLLSDSLKTIWDSFQSGWRYRPCVLGCIEQKRVQVYWLAEPKMLDMLSSEAEYQKDGALKTIILSKEKVKYQKVAAFYYRLKTYYIAEKEVVEKMLRAGISGLVFEEVKIDKGGA